MSLTIASYGVQDPLELQALLGSQNTLSFLPHSDDIASLEFPKIPDIILCNDLPDDPEKSLEMAQIFRMKYSNAKIFLIVADKFGLDKKTYKKNGFDDAFVLPWEKSSLLSAIENADIFLRCPELVNHTPVFIQDLDGGEALPFGTSVFLTLNSLLLPLTREGEGLTKDKVLRARTSNQNVVYVHKNDFPRFLSYFKLTHPNILSETEKFSALDKTCRELLSEMFTARLLDNTFQKAATLVSELRTVLDTFLNGAEPQASLIHFMNRPGNPYNHAINVAVYVGIFAKLTAHPHPLDLSLAGLLHDLGLSRLPEKFHDLNPDDVDPEEMAVYRTHPELSLNMIREKRVVLAEGALKLIAEQHVEHSSSLLSLADQFDYLTRHTSHTKTLTLPEAFKTLEGSPHLNPQAVRDLARHLL